MSLLKDEERLKSIKKWRLADTSDVTIRNYCKDYSFDVPLCKKIFETSGVDVLEDYPIMVFEEYTPAVFELVCEPKILKKGETSNCKLNINATEEITSIVLPIESEIFKFIEFEEQDFWELKENVDSTITLIPKEPFKGITTILGGVVEFKEDVVDDVHLELNNISYLTVDGEEFKSDATDDVNIYDDNKLEENTKNPNTVDKYDIVLFGILSFIVMLFMLRIKKELR